MKLAIVRHGESEFNEKNLFSGWEDVPLTDKGLEEATAAGERLKQMGLTFDVAFCSVLRRSIKSLEAILDVLGEEWLPVYKSWRLNERSYGALQRLNKEETAIRRGRALVNRWRKSYDAYPPLLDIDDPRHPGNDPRYRNVDPRLLPAGESLESTLYRVIPYWSDVIAPHLLHDENVLIVSHRNTLRALVKYLEKLSDDAIVHVDVPTGVPIVYELDSKLRILSKNQLTNDPV
ncbi:2,3-bisphosphoglycerate-dependent phosphoglycerate mutase [Sporolactobacillus spathodeae]|uniref:2,3-bisphosphoglycerate-dependent phosphoglycerate mutase n=1 Tax=Sporolactobacillus spathodeae TaxID=1465502 RepID=A0ABS2Q8T8_9BACL|nr:2,3-bisphosphoglycerate-dependent phosphoglycerate mutase [Sporolactobacillus spathodeae]MBM7658202.1 2,3-bisphosphoglycerate-dependent phosphoglycerate mutase [Sporolactobacillus spathodeae]